MEFYETVRELDAHVFVSDALYDDNKREHLKKMLERWDREINRYEEYFPPIKENKKDGN